MAPRRRASVVVGSDQTIGLRSLTTGRTCPCCCWHRVTTNMTRLVKSNWPTELSMLILDKRTGNTMVEQEGTDHPQRAGGPSSHPSSTLQAVSRIQGWNFELKFHDDEKIGRCHGKIFGCHSTQVTISQRLCHWFGVFGDPVSSYSISFATDAIGNVTWALAHEVIHEFAILRPRRNFVG